jgi:hypothetical protein
VLTSRLRVRPSEVETPASAQVFTGRWPETAFRSPTHPCYIYICTEAELPGVNAILDPISGTSPLRHLDPPVRIIVFPTDVTFESPEDDLFNDQLVTAVSHVSRRVGVVQWSDGAQAEHARRSESADGASSSA